MLPARHRLSRAADFTEVVRRGRRASRPLLTVHALLGEAAAPDGGRPSGSTPSRTSEAGAPPRAGLVVSKAVGGSVVRHRVARQLRHLLRERVGALPTGSRLVVRAAPAAATAGSTALGADLDAALARLTRPGARR